MCSPTQAKVVTKQLLFYKDNFATIGVAFHVGVSFDLPNWDYGAPFASPIGLAGLCWLYHCCQYPRGVVILGDGEDNFAKIGVAFHVGVGFGRIF